MKLLSAFKNSNNLLFTYFLVVLMFILLFPKFPLINVPGTYVAVRIEDLLIASLLIFWGISNIKNVKKLLSKTFTQSFLLFWLIGFLSLLSAIYVSFSVVPHLGFLHWLRRVEVMSLFIVAATVIKSAKQVKVFLATLLLANFVILIYGFGQIYFNFPVISTTNSEFSKGQILQLTPGARANSTFAGHYDLAVYLSIIVIFLGGYFLYFKKIAEKAMIVLSGGLSFLLLGLVASRTSFVGTFLALAVTFWLMGKRLLIIGLILVSLFAIAIIPELRHRLIATFTVNFIGGGGEKYTPPPDQVSSFTKESNLTDSQRSSLVEKLKRESTMSASESGKVSTVSADIVAGEPINPTELGVYRSYNIRTDVEWPRAIRGFQKNPLLGSGYSSISIATDNDLLRSLGEVGILGSLSFILIFIVVIKKIISALKNSEKFEKTFLIATLSSILAFLITSIFIDVFEASKVASLFWVILGIAFAVANKYGTFNEEKDD